MVVGRRLRLCSFRVHQSLPAIPDQGLSGTAVIRGLRPEHSCRHGRMDGIDETFLPVAAPIDAVARAPACFALDAVLEVDDDLRLPLGIHPSLVYVGGANVPQSI